MSYRRYSSWILLILLVAAPTAGTADSYSEDQVKAVFLYNFASFVRWPDTAFENRTSPILYCTVGGGSIVEPLRAVVQGESVNRRPLKLWSEPPGNGLTACHVLFIGDVGPERVAELLRLVEGAGVLTVTDRPQHAEHGVMIALLRRDRRVHPVIRLNAVRRGRLQVSAKLLGLATVLDLPRGDPR